MLEKLRGVYKVEKLRAILLMEADFNFANKLFIGVRAVRRAEEREVLPPDQGGSRRNHTSIEIAVLRRLFFDYVRLRRWNAALSSVDAQNCYDRIVHAVVSLTCRALGLPPGAVIGMLRAIQQMVFYLRTAFGDSKGSYSGTAAKPFQGLCQGNGAGPAGWLILSAILIRLLYRRRRAARFTMALTKTLFLLVAFMFVDDADLPQVARFAGEDFATVASRLQDSITDWSGFLNVTGGSLKPTKCCWFPVSWQWSQGVPSMVPVEEIDEEIFVTGPDGEDAAIEVVGPSAAREVLGVFQAADSNMAEQMQELKAKVDAWTANLENGFLHRRSVWRAFLLTIWKSIEYVLPATNFSFEEARSILHEARRKILPRLGVVRTLPLVFQESSRRYQGLGLPSVRTEELVNQLRLFLMHYRTPSSLGQMVACQEQDIVVELGVGTHFLQLDYAQYGFLATDCWLKSMWSKFPASRVQVQCRDAPSLPLRRQGDRYLMEVWIRSGDFSDEELTALNRCRKRKQVYSVADVATGDGQRLRPWAFQSSAPRGLEASDITFGTEHPTRADWVLWSHALRSLTVRSGVLLRSVGPWLMDPHLFRGVWYEPSTDTIFRQQLAGWDAYSSAHGHATRRDRLYRKVRTEQQLPIGLLRATARWTTVAGAPTARFEGAAATELPPPPDTSTFGSKLRHILNEWGATWVWDYLELPDGVEWLVDTLRLNAALLVCDGSYMPRRDPHRGAAAWIIASKLTDERIRSVVQSPSHVANAYRSELTGLYAVLAFVLAVCKAADLDEGSATLACDNISALNMAGSSNLRVPARLKHSDIIRAIRHVVAELPVELELLHVYGHQDDHVDFADLDLPAQLNTLCDSLAKQQLGYLIDQESPAPLFLPHEPAVLIVDGRKSTGDPGPPIRNSTSHHAMKAKLLARGDYWSAAAFEDTDWDAIEAAMATYPDLYAMWVTKHAFRFCGTNQQLCRYGERTCEYCPHDGCKERRVVESASHIMVCQDPSRRHALLESTEQLEDWLKAMDTEPSLRRAIVLYLRSYGYATFGSEQSRPTEVFAELSQAQDGIGWQNFTLGRFSTTFRRLMMAHYQNISSDRLASTWANGLVMRLLQIHHDQWLVRNEFVHEKDEAGMNREEAQALRDNIAAEYLQGSAGLLEDDLYLFETSYEEMLAWPVRDRRQWLLEVESARRCAEALDLEEEEDSQVPIDLPSPRRQSQASNSSTRSMLGRRRRRASTGRRTRARR